jgi:hypothetical protein
MGAETMTVAEIKLRYPSVLTDRRIVEAQFRTPLSPAPNRLKTAEEWAAYPIERIERWCSQFGALEFMIEFMGVRMVNSPIGLIEAYTPLPRPFDRHLCVMDLFGEPFFRRENQRVIAELPFIQDVLVEVLVRVEPRFGPYEPLHIGPVCFCKFFHQLIDLEYVLRVQDKKQWRHEHPDYGAKQASSHPTFERNFWWLQGRLIGDSPEVVTESSNEGDSLFASVQQSLRFISRPLRTCCTENNVAVPTHFDVIPIILSDDWFPPRYNYSIPKPTNRGCIWDDETFRWVSVNKLSLLAHFGEPKINLPIFTPVETAAIIIPEKKQTVIRPEKFLQLVSAERHHQKIEKLREYVGDQQEWTPELETEWEKKLHEEADKLLTRTHLQTPCGECKECLQAERLHISAFETCSRISRVSSGFYNREPGYVPGSGPTHFEPPDRSANEEDEKHLNKADQRRRKVSDRRDAFGWLLEENNDEAAESLWEKNLNDGGDYIDHGNQTKKGATAEWSPVARNVLNQEERKIFNPENTPRSPEKIAEIKAHPLYSNEERAYYMKLTNTPVTANVDGKPNTIIKRFIRHEEKRDEYLSAGSDPEFRFAFDNFLADHKDKPTQAGWYVNLCLNKRWMLYRLNLTFDETFPLDAAIPDIEMHAFMKLWLTKQAAAERMVRIRTSPKTLKAALQAARQRIDAAFDQVKAIHYLPAYSAVKVIRKPKR